jgi:type VI secretion system protein ImpI/type VI secretion system protein
MLRLGIENVPSLASGDPVEITLAEHGLVIGRAAHADWTLPDPNNHISSIHCEIDYRDGRYFLTDKSTNGTFINGARDRPAGPVQLRDGDLVQIGHYQLRVEELGGDAREAGAGGGTDGAFGGGIDWGAGSEAAARPSSATQFGREAPRPLFQSGDDPLMRAFAPPRPAPVPPASTGAADPFGLSAGAGRPDPFGVAAPAPTGDPFGTTPAAPYPFGVAAGTTPAADPFGTASAPPPTTDPFGTAGSPPPADPFGMAARPAPAPAPAADPFGMAATPAPAPTGDPFGMAPTPAPSAPTPTGGPSDPWALLSGAGSVDFGAMPGPTPAPTPPPVATSAPTPPPEVAASDALFDRLLAATGLERRDLGTRTPATVVDMIGQLLRQTADGLFRLLEARTRVRHQFGVGAQVTTFQRAGNNPLKWTRSPDHALKQMIGDPGPGFLDGTQAVRAAFEDLQAHEMAMMAAMQEAMQETIRRFAPDAIRARIGAKGWLKSVLPGSREATLWRAYESEFGAFADESEAAYLDVFARHFKKAYERIAAEAGRKD